MYALIFQSIEEAAILQIATIVESHQTKHTENRRVLERFFYSITTLEVDIVFGNEYKVLQWNVVLDY